MPQRPTTAVRVCPEARAGIARLAEAEGRTAAEFLEHLVDRAAGRARRMRRRDAVSAPAMAAVEHRLRVLLGLV